MRMWLILTAVVILGGGTAYFTTLGDGRRDFEMGIAEADSGPLVMTVETLGTVEPLTTVTVGCETTGKIIEISVDHDDPVKKDQVICRIDPELVEAENSKAAAELARARSTVVDAEIRQREQEANLPVATQRASGQLEEAKASLIAEAHNWKRLDKLYKEENATETEWTLSRANHERALAAVQIAQSAYDQAKLNEEFLPKRASEAVDQAKAAAQLAEAQFRQTQTQLERCIIRSPIDGIVLKRYLDVGTTVIAQLQSPSLFDIAPGLDRMKVLAKVSESDIVHIEVGQPAKFTVEGKQRVEFSGKILHKRNQPEIVQGVTTYTVILEVDNDDRRTLLPGMSVNVEIECVKRPEAVRIVNKALRFKPPLTLDERQELLDNAKWPDEPTDAEGKPANYCKKSHLWRFDAASMKWELVPVWIGITDNVLTEVLAGAKPGDKFVREFTYKSGGTFSLKEAIRLAQPGNRTL